LRERARTKRGTAKRNYARAAVAGYTYVASFTFRNARSVSGNKRGPTGPLPRMLQPLKLHPLFAVLDFSVNLGASKRPKSL